MTGRAPVYVISTGRAGSTFVARLLSAAGADPISHQLPGSRALNILGNLAAAGRMSVDHALMAAHRFGFDGSSTADPLRSMIITAALRAGRLEGGRIVHIVRDPRAFVTSFMNWKAASLKRRILHHVVPAWQPNPWLSGGASPAAWAAMSKFEHFCWIWNYKNRLFASLDSVSEYQRVRFEDLTAEGGDALADLGSYLGMALTPGASRRQRVNASEGAFPAWDAWSSEQASVLRRHCGVLMDEYGYGDEPAWHALCRTGPSGVTQPVSD